MQAKPAAEPGCCWMLAALLCTRSESMSDERRKRIEHLAWLARARKRRSSIFDLIPADIRPVLAFLERDESGVLGEAYWRLVNDALKNRLRGRLLQDALGQCAWPSSNVVWFHRYSDECGAMVVNVQWLAKNVDRLQCALAPDVLFMHRDGNFGFATRKTRMERAYAAGALYVRACKGASTLECERESKRPLDNDDRS